MREELLNYIVCPKCKSAFELEIYKQDGTHIIDGSLRCKNCVAIYQIKEGIPIIQDDYEIDDIGRKTAERFGYEWETFDFITDRYEAQFLDWISPIGKEFFAGKIVLDAGCGKGRHCILSSQFNAKEVIGIDLARGSVRAAFSNTRGISNIHIVQADIYNLPFRERTFDYIYTIGVLHHTPDPKHAFTCLVEKLKIGGTISAWVYGREGNWWIIFLVSPFRRFITSKLPLSITRGIALFLAILLQCILKLLYKPINEIQFLKPLSRFLLYNDYMYYISKFSFAENYSIVFDHLLPEIAFYIKKDEFLSWFKENNLKHISITRRTNNSWRGKGDRT